jgi:hypothetical protein
MVTAIEHNMEKDKVFSEELQMQLEALEVVKMVLEQKQIQHMRMPKFSTRRWSYRKQMLMLRLCSRE